MKRLSLVLFLLASSFGNFAQSFYNETPEAKHWVDSVFKKLSKEERIAQLMVVRLSAKTPDGVIFYDKKVEEEIRQYNIGAICLFQGNPVQQANYINYFQSIAKTPLMICIDGETGVGMRMTDSVMKFPDQLTLGAVNDTNLIYKIGKAIGEQCKRAGIQVNYAPVIDINNNPDNPVINFRSFGEDKYKVASYGASIMQGMQDAGIMACAKHFPGHGDVAVDSHLDLPVINKSIQQLDSLELYPFTQLFHAGVGSVMIAHLNIPAIDTTAHLPTSLSQKNVTGLLRSDLGFTGISFTDALEMQGVTKYFPSGDAALQSLIAGNDMLCLPGDISGSISKILNAIKNKQLNKRDIDARVKKVLLAKYNLGLNHKQFVDINNLTPDLNKEVSQLRADVAQNAITLLQLKHERLLPLQKNSSIAYVGIGLTGSNTLTDLLNQQYKADLFYFDYKADSNQAAALLDSLQAKYDEVIIGIHKQAKYPANNFGISNTAIQLIKKIQQTKPAITMVFGNPYSAKNFCNASNLVVCYEDDTIFQRAAFDWLNGKFTARGKLPVTICDQFKYGDGITTTTQDVLPFATPESVGLNSILLNKIDSISNDAIKKHATPGCVVLIARNGKIVFNQAYGYMTYDSIQPVTTSTVYDLASVTKISATTVSVMKLYEEGKLDLNKTLGDYLPWVRGTDKENLSVRNILLHQAGLVAFIPFYKETIDTLTGKSKPGLYKPVADDTFSIRVADSMYMRKDWIDTMYTRILQSPLEPPDKYVYSDNDFIFMGKIVEQLTGKTLDAYVRDIFYNPLQMKTTTFKPRISLELNTIAPTEHEQIFRLQLLYGYVHDPGAAMFGGVAGHAGLFSSAIDLAKLYQMLLNGGELNGRQYLKRETIRFFTSYQSNISRRGLGFDKPEKDNVMHKEPYPTRSAPPEMYGHTGFTGTCVWVDPAWNIVYIFLSNRVCPEGGANLKLSQLNVRGAIQEIIYQSLINVTVRR
jgi:beta-glucosidase-like glycosyl hydrolase/CubicO group peptidase (beta-lactamase class C family)